MIKRNISRDRYFKYWLIENLTEITRIWWYYFACLFSIFKFFVLFQLLFSFRLFLLWLFCCTIIIEMMTKRNACRIEKVRRNCSSVRTERRQDKDIEKVYNVKICWACCRWYKWIKYDRELMKSSWNERIDERKKSLRIVIKWKRFLSKLEAKRDRNKDIKSS